MKNWLVSVSKISALGLVVVSLATRNASAVTIDYGDFIGATVDFLAVSETNPGTDALFGAPSVLGDVLDFDPKGFAASASGGTASQIVDGQLNVTVMSKSNDTPISNIILREAGDYSLAGLGPAEASAGVGAAVVVSVVQVNGVDQAVDGGRPQYRL